jgi:hypothetical protein
VRTAILCATTVLLVPGVARAGLLDEVIPDPLKYPAAAVFVGTIVADVYFVGSGLRHSIRGERPDRTWATVETIVAAPQAAAGLIGFASEPGPELLALTGFAGSLGAHGVTTLARSRGSVDRPITPIESALPLLAIDLPFACVDLALAARGERIGRFAGGAEVVVAAPQVAYGIYAAAAHASDRTVVLAMTTFPLALLAHGVFELAVPSATTKPVARVRPAVQCTDPSCHDAVLTVAGVF